GKVPFPGRAFHGVRRFACLQRHPPVIWASCLGTWTSSSTCASFSPHMVCTGSGAWSIKPHPTPPHPTASVSAFSALPASRRERRLLGTKYPVVRAIFITRPFRYEDNSNTSITRSSQAESSSLVTAQPFPSRSLQVYGTLP